MKKQGISLLVHTRNSEKTLPQLLETTGWCDERIVIDCTSEDATVAIAESAGCRVVTTQHEFFRDSLRNEFLPLANYSWTLVLDSDEYLAIDAEQAIRNLIATAEENIGGFKLPRHNFFANKFLQGSNFYPDHQFRLFRTDSVQYAERHHQIPAFKDETLNFKVVEGRQSVHIYHHNYESLAEFIEKQARYAATDSYETDGEDFSFTEVLEKAQAAFTKFFDPTKDGSMSYAIATVMAWDQVMRGLLLWEQLKYEPPLPDEFPELLVNFSFGSQPTNVQEKAWIEKIELLEAENQSLRAEIEKSNSRLTMRVLKPLHRIWSKVKPKSNS